jgi:type I restriction enzyme M protein
MHLLKDGGRAGIVLPDGSLSGDGVKQRIREKILNECNLHTIIRLPNSVFKPYATVKTNLLFFTKGEPTKDIWYFEHPYPDGVKSYSKTRPLLYEEFNIEKNWWNNRIESKNSWKVSVESIVADNFNLDIKNPNVDLEEEFLSSSELINTILTTNTQMNDLIIKIKNELL